MNLTSDWMTLLRKNLQEDYFDIMEEKLALEYSKTTIFPEYNLLFNCYNLTPYSKIKVVILGQDPYSTPGFANGLAFSVNYGIKIPASLRNIYKELHDDLNCYIPNQGNLEKWAKQGVFLLNSCLSVECNKPNSHRNLGWDKLIEATLLIINKKEEPVVFILWGNNAREYQKYLTNKNHLIIKSSHPSPLSARHSFFNSKPFSKTNEFLRKHNLKQIDWQIENV